MIGELTPQQIEQVLHEQVIGRIGCHSRGRTYVVPVTYVYDGAAIIGHTGQGLKVEMMRENPEVCFEVEDLHGLPRWKSVLVYGRFEELQGAEADAALEQLVERLHTSPPSATAMPYQGAGVFAPPAGSEELASRPEVVYRIAISERTGRFEH